MFLKQEGCKNTNVSKLNFLNKEKNMAGYKVRKSYRMIIIRIKFGNISRAYL